MRQTAFVRGRRVAASSCGAVWMILSWASSSSSRRLTPLRQPRGARRLRRDRRHRCDDVGSRYPAPGPLRRACASAP